MAGKRHHWWHRTSRLLVSRTSVPDGWETVVEVTCVTCGRWHVRFLVTVAEHDMAVYGRLT